MCSLFDFLGKSFHLWLGNWFYRLYSRTSRIHTYLHHVANCSLLILQTRFLKWKSRPAHCASRLGLFSAFFFTKPDAGPGRDIKNKINFRFHWFHLLDFELWFGKWNGIPYKTSAQKTIARCDINNPFMNRVSIYCFQFSKMPCNFQTEEFRMILCWFMYVCM